MRRAAALALALSACTLVAPVIASAQAPAPAAPVKSPFKADRQASIPTGLTPNSVASPLVFPDKPVVLTWGEVPDAVGYTVEISDTPGFSSIIWKAETVQAIAVPEKLLPDGQYWWRVKAVDKAGTVGVYSDVARFAKTWPSTITGTVVSDAPGGAPVSHLLLQPYMTWSPVAGATTYEVQVAAGDQFAASAFSAIHYAEPFMTPAVVGALPDDGYAWRVRARDANDNPGPWATGNAFTKAWVGAPVVSPADGAAGHDMQFVWSPVEGAEEYEVQVTVQRNVWTGSPLRVNRTTKATSLTPSFSETRGSSLLYGDVWWRVRPKLAGVNGTWSAARKFTWQAPSAPGPAVVLTPATDTDSGLMPRLQWTPVSGATIYSVEIATDPQFNNLVESQFTESTSWTSRSPLRDNQVGRGYWWRAVPYGGSTPENLTEIPGVDYDSMEQDDFSKQTRVTLGTPATGGVVQAPPLLTWGSVPGIARYEVQLSQDGQFGTSARKATIWGTGVVPGTTRDGDTRLPDGTWNWRVRGIDGSGEGQTWSSVGQFTLNSPRPVQREPADGESVVYSPLIRWAPVPSASGYEVQVSEDPAFTSGTTDAEGLTTAQTALVPPRAMITTPGVHHWRVRARYGDELTGQWSPTRSFRSVFPPDFNLNSVPERVDFRRQVVVSGQLKSNGATVRKARLHLERRLYPADAYRAAGLVRTNTSGRFRFALRMTRSADYRLVWRESATNPEGSAAFGIQVAPRVTFRLAANRVVRRQGLLVKGSIYPKRPAVVQIRTSDGWQTVKKIAATKQRFAVAIGTGRLDPGTHRLRLWVPRDAQRKYANVASRQRGILIYDRFVIR